MLFKLITEFIKHSCDNDPNLGCFFFKKNVYAVLTFSFMLKKFRLARDITLTTYLVCICMCVYI
jgi:hypothetical protein